MATKAKSTAVPKATPAAAPPPQLATQFAAAVKLVDDGRHAEAVPLLEALAQAAQASGDWVVKRRAQVYLSLAQSHLKPADKAGVDPMTEVQALLNHRDHAAAQKLLEKLIKAQPERGVLYYLRAVALAQEERAEGAAEALKKALELDPDLIFLWHMEPDFAAMRKSSFFAFTEGR